MGRPRKKGRREPNGRPSRIYTNPKAQVAGQPHRMAVPEKYREWPEAGTEFGRLMLNGRITPAQHEAGARYAMLSQLYQLYMGIPSPNPRALDLLQASGGYDGLAPDVPEWLRKDYSAAFEACGGRSEQPVQKAVRQHAVNDQPLIHEGEHKLLILGLDRLVTHFGLDPALQISRSQK